MRWNEKRIEKLSCKGFLVVYKSCIGERGGCCYGCKHSKVDQTSAPVYESRGFLGQTPISSSKMLFKIDSFS